MLSAVAKNWRLLTHKEEWPFFGVACVFRQKPPRAARTPRATRRLDGDVWYLAVVEESLRSAVLLSYTTEQS